MFDVSMFNVVQMEQMLHMYVVSFPFSLLCDIGRYVHKLRTCCRRALILQANLSRRGEKILLLAYARSCQHMGESETAINAAPRAVSELRKSNFIPRELSSFLKESVKTAHFNLIAASL